MIYTPKKEKLWDCWIYAHEGKYYMYHLSLSRLGIGWDGISLAISDDLIHWTEYGRIFTKHPDAEWIGTGMIQKINDTFIMNFSEERPKGYQRIYFATSKDLIHWERTDNVCAPDGINYMAEPNDTSNTIPRWDSLGIINTNDKKPPYYAFCTANAKQVKHKNKAGALGLVTSNDGLNWKCLPNAFPDTEKFPAFEVPEHLSFGNRHYVIFCTSSYLGYRFDKLSNDMSGGTFYVTSDNALGPYRLPDGDCMLQGSRDNESVSMVSVGRTIKVNEKYYYYHIWGDNGPNGWVGTIKLLEEEKPYKLVLKYNPINEKMKGKLLTSNNFKNKFHLIKNIGKNPPMLFDIDESIKFKNLGTSAGLSLADMNGSFGSNIADLTDGRIIEFNLSINNGEGAGIYFENEANEKHAVMLNFERQRLEFGYLKNGWGPNLVLVNDLYQKFNIEKLSRVKILARKYFIEVYINDIYVSSWRTPNKINPNKFGLYFEDANGTIDNLKIWEMK